MIAYRVAKWADRYENNRTRELKRLDWVPVPNDMSNLGYLELVDHPNGAAHLGAWLAILEIASRQPKRGEIPQGSAGTTQSLARISRLPVALFEEVIPRLASMDWIESFENQQVAKIMQDGAGISHPSAGKPALKGREGKGIEENRNTPPAAKTAAVSVIDPVEGWFSQEFWPAYPRREAKVAALKAARAVLKTPELRAAALRALTLQLPDLTSRPPDKRPHPATWISGRRWEDEPALPFISMPRSGENGNGKVGFVESVEREFQKRYDEGRL